MPSKTAQPAQPLPVASTVDHLCWYRSVSIPLPKEVDVQKSNAFQDPKNCWSLPLRPPRPCPVRPPNRPREASARRRAPITRTPTTPRREDLRVLRSRKARCDVDGGWKAVPVRWRFGEVGGEEVIGGVVFSFLVFGVEHGEETLRGRLLSVHPGFLDHHGFQRPRPNNHGFYQGFFVNDKTSSGHPLFD